MVCSPDQGTVSDHTWITYIIILCHISCFYLFSLKKLTIFTDSEVEYYYHNSYLISLYSANPFTVNRYFCRGWRGESGYNIRTNPSLIAGVKWYSKKFGRCFSPKAFIISAIDNSLSPISFTNPKIRGFSVCNKSPTCSGACSGTCSQLVRVSRFGCLLHSLVGLICR